MKARLFLVAGCLGSVALGLGLIASVSLLPALSDLRDQQLESRFRARHGGKALPELYPPRSTNETAAAIDRIAAELHLGISIDPETPEAQRIKNLHLEVRKLIGAKHCSVDGSLSPPTPELRRYLDQVRPSLARVVHLLETSPKPLWARDFSRGFKQDENRDDVGIVKLQVLLVFDSRERLRSGEAHEVERALAILDASWRLNMALSHESHQMASHLQRWVFAYQLCLLRSVPGNDWRGRLQALDLFSSARLLHESECYFELLMARESRISTLDRATYLDRSARLLSALERLERTDLATFDPELFHRDFVRRRPTWPNRFFEVVDADFWLDWGAAAELELAAEQVALGMEERERLAFGLPRGFDRRSSKIAGLEWAYWPVHEEGTGGGTLIELVTPLAYQSKRALPRRLYIRQPIDFPEPDSESTTKR